MWEQPILMEVSPAQDVSKLYPVCQSICFIFNLNKNRMDNRRTENEDRILHAALLKKMSNLQSQMFRLRAKKAEFKEKIRLMQLEMVETATSIENTLLSYPIDDDMEG